MSIIRVINKLKKILSSHQKMRIFELCLLMIVGGFLEMMSVSLIMPFMNLVMDSESIMDKWYVKDICSVLNVSDSKDFLIISAILLAAVYIIKNIYLLAEYNVQYKFVYGNMFSMQSKLLSIYIHRPYEFFLSADSGEIIRIMNSDTPNTFELLTTVLNLFTELVVSGMLITTVFIITPKTTIFMAAIMILVLMATNRITKPLLNRAGRESQKASAGMNKWLLQSIHGIKEIKVMVKEKFFQEQYDYYGGRYIQALRRGKIMGIAPRFFIEAVSMSALFVAISVFIYSGEELNQIVPILSAVAMAALRLLPSANRISASIANIAYMEPMLDKLTESLNAIDEKIEVGTVDNREKVDDLFLKSQINFKNITFRYPNAPMEVLHNASFSVKKGETVGIIGASGAGKTTAIDIILGLLKPMYGQVLIDERDISEDLDSWYKLVSYIPQLIFMMDASIRENVAFGVSKEDVSDELVMKSLEQASLLEYTQKLPQGLDTQIGERGIRLSGGQRQRIGIARALYRQSEVLIFDEATSALDNQTEEEIMKSIHRLQGEKTMIIIAHRTSTLESCDHIYRVEDGKIKQVR